MASVAYTEPKSPMSTSQPQHSSTSLAKILSVFACCGRLKLVWKSSYSRPSTVVPSNSESIDLAPGQGPAGIPSGINRGNTRPKAIEVEDPWSRREESDATHRYYCPICMYYFEEMNTTLCCHHNLCQDCYNDIAARPALAPVGKSSSSHTDPILIRMIRRK